MQIFRSLAGYTFGRADIVRRAMAKKKADVLENERGTFVGGCVERGIDKESAVAIFDEMADFAKYAFNKSHACAYSYLTYQTAYLKYYYPAQYMASLITSTLDDEEKVNFYVAECRALGIKVLPPDVNESGVGFDVMNGAIRFGLLAVKNVGVGFVSAICEERRRGRFKDLEDFLMRMSSKSLNRKMVECLIMSGACDSFGRERSLMAAVLDDAITTVTDMNRRNVTGQMDFFAEQGEGETKLKIDYPEQRGDTLTERLAMEKEVTGVYLSGHPLDAYSKHRRFCASISDIRDSLENATPDYREGQVVDVLGIVGSKKVKETKKGEIMAFVTLLDVSTSAEVVVFPKTFDTVAYMLEPDRILVAKCEITLKDDELKLLARSFTEAVPDEKFDGETEKTIADTKPKFTRMITAESLGIATPKPKPEPEPEGEKKVYLRLKTEDKALVKRISALVAIFEGSTEVILYFEDQKKYVKLVGSGIELSSDVKGDLDRLVGQGNVVVK